MICESMCPDFCGSGVDSLEFPRIHFARQVCSISRVLKKEFSVMKNRWLVISLALTLCAFFSVSALAQETTGGLQGTVKDPSGAVVPNAKVVVTGASLVGSKELQTDSSGYYRFANLPPGTYTITVTAKGFRTLKREGLVLEVGHLPSVDISLEVGTADTVVAEAGRELSSWWKARILRTSLVALRTRTFPSSSFRNSRLRLRASKPNMAALSAAWSTWSCARAATPTTARCSPPMNPTRLTALRMPTFAMIRHRASSLPALIMIHRPISRRETTSGSLSRALPLAARSQRTACGSSWVLRRWTLPGLERWTSVLPVFRRIQPLGSKSSPRTASSTSVLPALTPL